MRQRKPRIDLIGYENDYGVVLRTERAGKWFIKCKMCNKEHEQSGREIKTNSASRLCEKFKPHNWSGLDRDDAIMRRQYGISTDEFNKLLKFQGDRCAICSKPIELIRKRINIDHDHITNKVRGILCTGCNTGLGHLGDDIAGLKRALYYLENTPYDEFKLKD